MVRGLPALPDYPVAVEMDASWVAGEADAGAMAIDDARGSPVISVHAITELADVPGLEVPFDVARFLRMHRDDVLVTDERAVTHSGIPAQRFRLAMRDQRRSPSDLWAVEGNRYKPLATAPMEVVAVRSSQGLVWLWTEWESEDEAAAIATFDAALQHVTIQ